METPGGLYARDGSRYVPSDFTRGPWRADAQHGGPPAALLAHVCQPELGDDEFIAQLAVELVRPVPLTSLSVDVSRYEVSGRVARVSANLGSDGETVAHASALVLRTSELDAPEWIPPMQPAAEPPSTDARVEPPRWASGDLTTYHRNAVEHRFTQGTFREPGPAVDWIRLRLAVIEGEETTGLERIAAAADFGSGISAVYGAESSFGLINANLVISLHRPLVGEWVSLDSITHVGPQGTGIGVSQLGDVKGVLGVATQSLLAYRLSH